MLKFQVQLQIVLIQFKIICIALFTIKSLQKQLLKQLYSAKKSDSMMQTKFNSSVKQL